MSWNNVLPWSVLIRRANYQAALMSGAFENDIHVSEMRADWWY